MIPIEGVLDKYGVEYNDSIEGNQKVLCPFHDDSIASASVNLELGLFRCFGSQGCPEGDAIRILELREGLEFLEAKRLAEELAGGSRAALPRRPNSTGTFLPRKSGSGKERGGWRSPWARH
jgi:DNA primase